MTTDKTLTVNLDSISMTPELKEHYYLSLADAFVTNKIPTDSDYLGEQECTVEEDGSLTVMFHVKHKPTGEWTKVRITSFPPKSWSFKALS
jgi:hypothetical protein